MNYTSLIENQCKSNGEMLWNFARFNIHVHQFTIHLWIKRTGKSQKSDSATNSDTDLEVDSIDSSVLSAIRAVLKALDSDKETDQELTDPVLKDLIVGIRSVDECELRQLKGGSQI